MNFKDALAMGFELSGYFLASYWSSPFLAQKMDWKESHILTLLMGLSLIIWTFRAYIRFEKQKT